MYTLFNDFFLSQSGFFRLFCYTTTRCAFALMISFLIVFLLMPKYISFSHRWQISGQPIRDNYLPEHSVKKGTPTMGGVMIILSSLFSVLLFSNLKNIYVIVLFCSLLLFGLIGFFDDYNKIKKKDVGGIHAKTKLLFQCFFAFLSNYTVNRYIDSSFYSNTLTFPFFKNLVLDLGIFYTLFRVFVIVGSSNAVNLTDGLDGLAIVPIIVVNAVFIVFSYIIGNAVFSKYLFYNYQYEAQEICIFLSAIIGASIGFLWYNVKPAQIFMGDTGSLALGGVIGVVSVMLKCEFLLAIVGGLFVIETLSDVLQIFVFKITKGKKRLFKMAPLHHHFEKKGWSETQIVVRFWIISILFALLGLSSLKLR